MMTEYNSKNEQAKKDLNWYYADDWLYVKLKEPIKFIPLKFIALPTGIKFEEIK